jgi:hypothetical protein
VSTTVGEKTRIRQHVRTVSSVGSQDAQIFVSWREHPANDADAWANVPGAVLLLRRWQDTARAARQGGFALMEPDRIRISWISVFLFLSFEMETD